MNIIENAIERSNKKELFKESDIDQIVSDLLSLEHPITRDNLKNIKYDRVRKYNNSKALFDEENNELVIDLNLIYEESLKEVFKSKSSILEQNLRIIIFLLHELEHVKEKYKMTKKNLEAELLECSTFDVIYNKFYFTNKRKFNKSRVIREKTNKMFASFYEKNYLLIPCERIAETNAIKQLINSLNAYGDFKIIYEDIYTKINELYYDCLASGYEFKRNGDMNIPLIDYRNLVYNPETFPKCNLTRNRLINEAKKLSVDEAMKFGLPITEHKKEKFLSSQSFSKK